MVVAKYVPSPKDWVRDQVELYERSGGTEGTTLRDTGLPVIIVTHVGNKTGVIRKTPLMRVPAIDVIRRAMQRTRHKRSWRLPKFGLWVTRACSSGRSDAEGPLG